MRTWLASLRVALIAACLGAVTHAWALTPPEINVATAYAADNFQTRNLQRYADEVLRATGGKVVIKVHPAGSLIKPAQIFTGVREGRAQGGEVIMSSLAKEIPLFGMDALPFIVSGYADARTMWEVSRAAVDAALAARGLKLLYAVPWPPQSLYSRTPINVPDDFAGLRMRAYNPATERIAQLVHANPVTVQVVDLARTIADGQVDLMITSSWTGVETQAWTRLLHYYKVSAWIPKNVVFLDKALFDKLDDTSRTTLLELARSAETRGWKMSEDSDRDYEAQLAAHGIKVASMDFFVRRHLDRIGETLAREWLREAGPDELQVLLHYMAERSRQHASAR